MDTNIIIYFSCIIALFIVGKLFAVPLVKILKLVLNSFLGGILIYIINLIGNLFSFHIGLNYVTAIFVGLCGVPGVVLLIVLKFLLG